MARSYYAERVQAADPSTTWCCWALLFRQSDPIRRFFGDTQTNAVCGDRCRLPGVFAILSAVTRDAAAAGCLAGPQMLVTQFIRSIYAAIVMLMHASGGISSGLGGLLVVFIGAGEPRHCRMHCVLRCFAAIATLRHPWRAVLYPNRWRESYTVANFPAAGDTQRNYLRDMRSPRRPLARRIRSSARHWRGSAASILPICPSSTSTSCNIFGRALSLSTPITGFV